MPLKVDYKKCIGCKKCYTICPMDIFSWGDDTGEVCIGPYQSGEEVTISHIWLENGTYTISVKASDILGAESDYANLTVKISMSRSVAYYRNIIYEIFQVLKKIKSDIFIFK